MLHFYDGKCKRLEWIQIITQCEFYVIHCALKQQEFEEESFFFPFLLLEVIIL